MVRRAVSFTRKAAGRKLPQPVRVVDTVGAGDAFTAALTMGLLSGMDIGEVHAIAAGIAGYVCSRPGATPAMPETFCKRFQDAGELEFARPFQDRSPS